LIYAQNEIAQAGKLGEVATNHILKRKHEKRHVNRIAGSGTVECMSWKNFAVLGMIGFPIFPVPFTFVCIEPWYFTVYCSSPFLAGLHHQCDGTNIQTLVNQLALNDVKHRDGRRRRRSSSGIKEEEQRAPETREQTRHRRHHHTKNKEVELKGRQQLF